jgi:hypothetical protein
VLLLSSGGGAGTVRAEVQLTGGRTITSSPTPFSLTSKTGAASSLSETQSCADITTGLFLSPLLVAPNQSLPNDAQQFKACRSGSRTVPLTLGPFTEDACGEYTVGSDLGHVGAVVCRCSVAAHAVKTAEHRHARACLHPGNIR